MVFVMFWKLIRLIQTILSKPFWWKLFIYLCILMTQKSSNVWKPTMTHHSVLKFQQKKFVLKLYIWCVNVGAKTTRKDLIFYELLKDSRKSAGDTGISSRIQLNLFITERHYTGTSTYRTLNKPDRPHLSIPDPQYPGTPVYRALRIPDPQYTGPSVYRTFLQQPKNVFRSEICPCIYSSHDSSKVDLRFFRLNTFRINRCTIVIMKLLIK